MSYNKLEAFRIVFSALTEERLKIIHMEFGAGWKFTPSKFEVSTRLDWYLLRKKYPMIFIGYLQNLQSTIIIVLQTTR